VTAHDRSVRAGARLVCVAAALLVGAAPPELVRVRVPADKARSFFPAGAELRGMTAHAFDALWDAARAGAARAAAQAEPRLLRARHFASWRSRPGRGRACWRSTRGRRRSMPGPTARRCGATTRGARR
jgi:thioesterase domain-containing protein